MHPQDLKTETQTDFVHPCSQQPRGDNTPSAHRQRNGEQSTWTVRGGVYDSATEGMEPTLQRGQASKTWCSAEAARCGKTNIPSLCNVQIRETHRDRKRNGLPGAGSGEGNHCLKSAECPFHKKFGWKLTVVMGTRHCECT